MEFSEEQRTFRAGIANLRMLEGGGISTTYDLLLKYYYSNGTTTLNRTDLISPPILPTRGVKESDPLPSVLFNTVIDHLLRSLLKESALGFSGGTTRAMAFADDMN